MKTHRIQLKNNFTPYPKYKDSGIEWIGEIPAEWEIEKISSIFKFPKDKVSDKEYEPLSVTYGGIKKRIENAAKSADGTDRKRVLKGDIAINGRSDRKGAVGMSEYDGSISLVYHVLRRRNENVKTKYFHYLFRSKIFSEEFYRWGRGIVDDLWTTRSDEMKRIGISVPSSATQQKIADYLDEKTALIDQIIEKKRKLITLLREKRTVTINHAVTKGLDPKAKLIDLGIDWVGQIPNGWKMRKMKYVARVQASNVDKITDSKDPEVLLCNYVDVYKNEYINDSINFMRSTASREQIKKVGLKKGDVLLTKDSETADDIGVPALVREDVKGLVSGYHLYVAKPKEKLIHGEFLFRYLQSKFVRVNFETNANGITRFGLGSMDVKDLPVLMPSMETQSEIAKYLDKKTALTDRLVLSVEKSIKILQEFKSSLISNVVTGKIKV